MRYQLTRYKYIVKETGAQKTCLFWMSGNNPRIRLRKRATSCISESRILPVSFPPFFPLPATKIANHMLHLKLNRTDYNVKTSRTFLLCIASMLSSSSKHHYTHGYDLRPQPNYYFKQITKGHV